MESMDAKRARQVWERVHPQPGQQNAAPREAAFLAGELAGLYRFLPEGQAMARQLQEAQRCLRGLVRLQGGTPLPLQPPGIQRPAQPVPACWSREQQLQAALTAGEGDPETGFLYAQLRRESQQRCRILAERLGK